MSNDLMIPSSSEVPAYILNQELAKQANDAAACGISTGVPPRIKIAGSKFQLVDGNGDVTPYPPASLVAGPDGNTYMPVIVLGAKRPLQKTWYAAKYNPNEEASAPDCFSDDAVKPHPSITSPQSDSCETCPLNAFGSGTDQDGNATNGKACTDTKVLAVHVPNKGIHALRIPPSSLKNFGLFVKQLSNAGIPLGSIKTLLGFDLACDYAKLEFKFGGYLDERFIPKVKELSGSEEVVDIIGGVVIPSPAPKQIDNSAAEAAAKKKAAAEAAAKKKAAAEAAAKKKAEEAAAAEVAEGDDLGLGSDDLGLDAEPADTGGSDDDGPTDDELAAELGL